MSQKPRTWIEQAGYRITLAGYLSLISVCIIALLASNAFRPEFVNGVLAAIALANLIAAFAAATAYSATQKAQKEGS